MIILIEFDYGNMVVDENSIDKFWLEGESKISQRQQIDFLKRLYNQKFGIDESTYSNIKELMVIDKNENYTLSGKTGWSIREGNNVGWFVGYFEAGENIFFVATNIEPYDKTEMIDFTTARKDITMEVMKLLELIK
jgi:beta-lactamase class D